MRSFVPLVAAFTGLCLAGPVKRADDGPVWDTVPAPSNTPAVDFIDIFGGPIDPKNMTAQEAIKYYSWNKDEPSDCQLRSGSEVNSLTSTCEKYGGTGSSNEETGLAGLA
ncbi:hypothetical protein VCV18_004313 [Metarhizium anisopliae]